MIDTVSRCLSEGIDHVQDFLYSAIATVVEELFRDFLQDILDSLMSGMHCNSYVAVNPVCRFNVRK